MKSVKRAIEAIERALRRSVRGFNARSALGSRSRAEKRAFALMASLGKHEDREA